MMKPRIPQLGVSEETSTVFRESWHDAYSSSLERLSQVSSTGLGGLPPHNTGIAHGRSRH